VSVVATAILVACATWFGAEPPAPTHVASHSSTIVGSMATAESWEIAGGKARVHMMLHAPNYMGTLEGDPGLVVPEHVHTDAVEMLHVLEGGGWMVVDGKRSRIEAGMMIQVPRGVKHSFMIPPDQKVGFKAVQVYTPGGPEQRFKAGRRIQSEGKQ